MRPEGRWICMEREEKMEVQKRKKRKERSKADVGVDLPHIFHTGVILSPLYSENPS